MTRQAVLYARVSSKEQEKEGFSIPAQLKLLRSYAAERGLVVAKEFVDVETAKQTGRTGFGEMLSLARSNPSCRVVLVEKTDRLYRNIRDWVTLDELNLEIHLVKENLVLSRESRSSEKFMHGIKVLMAKNYIDNLSEEARKGMKEKAEEGIWPSYAPYGYRNIVGPNGKKTIEPDPIEAPIVRKLFERFSTGNYPLKELARMARTDGMLTRKSKVPVLKSTVHKMLRNRIYTGDFDWDGVFYPGTHSPITSKEIWEHTQMILDGRYIRKSGKGKKNFAFSSLISCGHCGCSLVGQIQKERYVYYHCTGFKGKCSEPYVREEVLEKEFGCALEALRFDNEVLGWVRQSLLESHDDERKEHEEALARLQDEYNRIQKRIEAVYVDKVDGQVDVRFFEKMTNKWREEQSRILRDIETHQVADQRYLQLGVLILELASKAKVLFEKQTPSEKRRLLNFLLSNCSWKEKKLTFTYRQPFDILAVAASTQEEVKAAKGARTAKTEKWWAVVDLNH